MATYHSQHGEDKWLNDNWSRLGLPEKGFYIELGAMDGIEINNTKWLEDEKGWMGLLIEPVPDMFAKLKENRPNNINERVAIGLKRRAFHISAPGWSGFDAIGKAVHIPVTTLTGLLNKHGIDHVDVMFVDVEGSELEVWKTFDHNKYKPTLVVFEVCHLPNILWFVEQLRNDGYRQITTLGANMVFAREFTQAALWTWR